MEVGRASIVGKGSVFVDSAELPFVVSPFVAARPLSLGFVLSFFVGTVSTCTRSTMASHNSCVYADNANAFVSTHCANRDMDEVRSVVGRCAARRVDKRGGTSMSAVIRNVLLKYQRVLRYFILTILSQGTAASLDNLTQCFPDPQPHVDLSLLHFRNFLAYCTNFS